MCAVEWKKLGDVCKIMNGKDYKSFNEGIIPVYGSGGVIAYIDTFAYDKPSVLLPRKGSLSNVFYVDEPFWTVDTIYWTMIDGEIIEPRYFFYYMLMQDLEKLNFASGAVPSLTQAILNRIDIPIPSLAKQQEIVSQLDTFTTLISNLESELDMRRKQYEHYRNQLLDFEGVEGVEWKKIGSITRVFSASRVHKNEWTNEGVPFWRSSDLISFFNKVDNPKGKAFISYELYEKLSAKSGKISKDDILVTGGGTIGIPYIVPNDNPLYVKDADLLCIVHNDAFVSRYLYQYMLCSDYRNYLSSLSNNATIAHYTISQINDTIIPIPSKQTQREIVEKLDAFEQLIQSLETEIKLRKQQYEYYREKLLTFD